MMDKNGKDKNYTNNKISCELKLQQKEEKLQYNCAQEKLSQSVKNKESKNQRQERITTQEDTVQRSRAT